MLWSELRFILKTSSVTPDFFYVFYLILSFSTVSQSLKKSVRGKFLGANVLKAGTSALKNHNIPGVTEPISSNI